MANIASRHQTGTVDSVDDLQEMSKGFEKLGDTLSLLDLHGPAFRSYQQMVCWLMVRNNPNTM